MEEFKKHLLENDEKWLENFYESTEFINNKNELCECLYKSGFLKNNNTIPAIQYLLGCIFELGWGNIEKNTRISIQWYKKAAHQGYLQSQNILAYILSKNPQNDSDIQLAMYWLKKGAEQNHLNSILNLGIMYEKAWGIFQNFELAFYWYFKGYKKSINDSKNNTVFFNNLKNLFKNKNATQVVLNKLLDMNQTIKKQKQIIEEQNQYITELELRPPEIGGPEYKKAKKRFYNNC
jgi:hypothetical protein